MSLIDKATEIIALPLDDDTLEARAGDLRKDINNWVARYRRDDRFSGKPSFSNLYSAVNAIAGHYNSFGPTARIPAKRLDRIKVELEQAKRFVNNGR